MSKRNMKKIVMAMATAAVVAGTTLSNVIPVFAEPGEESGGSIVVDEGEIVLDTADIDTLQEELVNLEEELPDAAKLPYYGTARRSRLNSKGIIDYANKTVVIDSSDFAYLADEIDMLESAYKSNTVSALNAMRTFFLPDGSIGHDPDSEGISGTEAVKLSFDTIISGIMQSQSVDHLAEQGIAGAIEDNLSKGTAAWVDGELIIGNGADNDVYYKKGIDDVVANPNDYGVSTAPKYFNLNGGGTLTYRCPDDGVYTFNVKISWGNKENHKALDNRVNLHIGSENLTIFRHYHDYSYENFHFVTEGTTNYTTTRTCAAGTVITLDVSNTDFFADFYAYTCAALAIY